VGEVISVGAGEYENDEETDSVDWASDASAAEEATSEAAEEVAEEADWVADGSEVEVADTVEGPVDVAGAAVKIESVAEVGKPTTRGVVAIDEELVVLDEGARVSEA